MADATKVLSGFSSETLQKIIKRESIIIEQEEPKKNHLVEAIVSHVEKIGFNLLTEYLSKEEIDNIAKYLKLDLSAVGENKKPSKQFLRKRLTDKAVEIGVGKLLDKVGEDTDLVAVLADTVGMDEEIKDGKKAVKDVAKEVVGLGLDSLFNRFDIPFLKTLAEEAGLNANTLQKARIVKSIISGKNVKATKDPDAKKRIEKAAEEAQKAAEKKDNRPDIKKGITYQEMFQLYLHSELFDYCKKEGLKVSGKKSELIKRIIAYHNGDKENTVAKPKTKKEGSAKKDSKKDSKKETNTAKPKTTKKSEEKEDKENGKEETNGTKETTKKTTKKSTK